jgi:hypothetical protein
MGLAENDDMIQALAADRPDQQSTALVQLDRTQTFLVTHVFHPLYGRELRLIDQYLAWGEDRVCFRDDGGGLRYLPTAWTEPSLGYIEEVFGGIRLTAAGRTRIAEG